MKSLLARRRAESFHSFINQSSQPTKINRATLTGCDETNTEEINVYKDTGYELKSISLEANAFKCYQSTNFFCI